MTCKKGAALTTNQATSTAADAVPAARSAPDARATVALPSMPTSVAIPVAGDHELACPAGDVGLHVHHIGAVDQWRVGACHSIGGLGDGQALAGERGLGDLQPLAPVPTRAYP